MIGFNSKSQVNKEFKLADLVKSLRLSKEQKQCLGSIKVVQLANVFDSQSLGLKQSEEVKLIYVYRIDVVDSLPLDFIKALDKKTNAHTIFEIVDSECITYIMSNKKVADNIVVGTYYIKQSDEFDGSTLNIDTLLGLYKQLLYFVCDIEPKEDDTTAQIAERKANIIALQKEIEKLERMRDKEKQPNKRIMLNEEIAKLEKEIKK